MSRARLMAALLGLAFGFVFYLAHRSDHTLSNRLVRSVCAPLRYGELQRQLHAALPVTPALRGCLPSALWCFIVASLLGGWQIRVGWKRRFPLAGAGVLVNAAWEVIQWLNWTDGRGDWRDVVAGLAGWALAHLALAAGDDTPELSTPSGWRWGVVVSGLACMGLADVWK